MTKELLFKRWWILLLLVQAGSILFFVRDTKRVGLFNRDAVSYHIQWSKASETLDPFAEPVLADPGHDLVRLLFSMPHFVLGLTGRFFSPVSNYVIWCCIGLLANYFSLFLFASALGFKKEHAHAAALIHYTLYHWISQLPPLSGNQLHFVVNAILAKPGNVLHFGPRQYPHDIFFYPLLYTLLALTLFGIKKIKEKQPIRHVHVFLWGFLCLLLPFNYLYHWFEYAFLLFFLVAAGVAIGWWRVSDIRKSSPALIAATGIVLLAWACLLLFQNSQLRDAAGYRFALMGGLTEARFFLLPAGLVLRVLIWSAVAWIVLKMNPGSLLLVGFMIGCVLLMNMQLIVGRNIQPGHWAFGVDRIFAWIMILVAASLVKRYLHRWTSKLIPAAVVVALAFFVVQTIVSWNYFARMSQWGRDRAAVIEFLNSLPAGVVLVPEIWLETDVLIYTHHRGFLPRGAQSAVSLEEDLQRLSHAALIMGYSREGLIRWLHIRDVRFFGVLYRMEKEYSSSYYFDPGKRAEVLRHAEGSLASWDQDIVDRYASSAGLLNKRLDYLVLHASENLPPAMNSVIFRNDHYVVIKSGSLTEKKWGSYLPISEEKYPLDE